MSLFELIAAYTNVVLHIYFTNMVLVKTG